MMDEENSASLGKQSVEPVRPSRTERRAKQEKPTLPPKIDQGYGQKMESNNRGLSRQQDEPRRTANLPQTGSTSRIRESRSIAQSP